MIWFEIHQEGEPIKRIDVSAHYYQCTKGVGWKERAILREQATKMLIGLMQQIFIDDYKDCPGVMFYIVFESKLKSVPHEMLPGTVRAER